MSAFDDEFGLFGDESSPGEEERKPTLGARRIASTETVIDEIEPEDEPSPRRRIGRGPEGPRPRGGPNGAPRPGGWRDRAPRPPLEPAVAQARAIELLTYLAKKLVSRPDDVIVEMVEGDRGPIVELEVHPEDLGKVIGRSGRVAQALRTLVRAGAESRISVDIVDTEDDETLEEDIEHAGSAAVAESPENDADADAESDEDEDDDDDLDDDDEDLDGDEADDEDEAADGKESKA